MYRNPSGSRDLLHASVPCGWSAAKTVRLARKRETLNALNFLSWLYVCGSVYMGVLCVFWVHVHSLFSLFSLWSSHVYCLGFSAMHLQAHRVSGAAARMRTPLCVYMCMYLCVCDFVFVVVHRCLSVCLWFLYFGNKWIIQNNQKKG